jgi:hypothetical protein
MIFYGRRFSRRKLRKGGASVTLTLAKGISVQEGLNAKARAWLDPITRRIWGIWDRAYRSNRSLDLGDLVDRRQSHQVYQIPPRVYSI